MLFTKIISKMLSSQLKSILSEIIDPTQIVFVPGRYTNNW